MLGLDARTIRVVWTVVVFAAVAALVYALRRLVAVLAFSLVFAYLLFPLVQQAERWLPFARRRAVDIALTYLVVCGALAAAGAALGPRLTANRPALTEKLPEVTQQVESGEIVGNVLERFGWDRSRAQRVEALVREHADEVIAYVQRGARAALAWFTRAWVIVLVPIFAFFFLEDGDRFGATAESLLPGGRAGRVWRETVRDIHVLFGQYVRALVVLCVITFVVFTVVFLIARVPYAVPLAAFAGALEFVPVVGPLAAAILIMAVALVGGLGHPWLLLAFLIGWRPIQDYVTSPLVMGSEVELHPALVIFAVIAGAEIGGVVGAFVSIPLMAAIRLTWRACGRTTSGPRAACSRPRDAPSAAVTAAGRYVLKRLSNPRRMSLWRVESGEASRSTVTRRAKDAHSFAAFLSTMRSGMGSVH